MERKGDVLYNVLDQYTGDSIFYKKVSTWGDGTVMDDVKCDGVIFRKYGDEYFKRVITGSINIEWFGAVGDGVYENTNAINIALELGRVLKTSIFIPDGTFISDEIILKAGDTILGNGDTSIVKLKSGSSGGLVRLFNNNSYNTSVSSLCFDGNASNQSNDSILVDLVTEAVTVDARHNWKNIIIRNVKGDGFRVSGRGDSKFYDFLVLECSGKGAIWDCFDTSFMDWIIGRCLLGGVDILKGSNRIVNLKTWICAYGVNSIGTNINATNVDIQDVLSYGLRVAGQLQTWEGVHIDSVGYLRGQVDTESTAIIGTSAAQYCKIKGVVRDRKQFSITGSLNYALDWLGTFGEISLSVRDILIRVYKDEYSIPQENSILITGTLSQVADITYNNRDRNISRLISKTRSSGTISNEWIEVLRFNLTNGFDCAFKLSFTSNQTTKGQTAEVFFFAKVQSNSVLEIQAKLISMTDGATFGYDSFRICNNGPTEDFIIYAKKISTGGRVSVYELSNSLQNQNAVRVSYNSNPVWTSIEPTGVNMSTTDAVARFGSKLLLSSDQFSGTILTTGNTVNLLGTLHTPASISYDTAFNLKWTGRFMVNPENKIISASGFIEMYMPTVGTVIAGMGSTPSVTVTSNGIPMSTWACLIAEYEIGGSQSSFVYKIGQFGSIQSGGLLPNQIMLASRSNDTTLLKIGSGISIFPGESYVNGKLQKLILNEDIEITDSTKGIILKSPDNKRWRLTVSNSGSPVFTEIV